MGDTLSASALDRWRTSPSASFIEEVMVDPETGLPFRFAPRRRTSWNAHFGQRPGRLVYLGAIYSCPKKSGKTGFAAMHVLATTLVLRRRFRRRLLRCKRL